MITIVDYDAGNIRSIVNMLRAIGVKSRVTGDAGEVRRADRLLLPGVGHFDHGMRALSARGLDEAMTERAVVQGKPLLGICLGAQLLTAGSEEGSEAGLGWIDGRTVAFDRARLDAALRVPHMGWADTWATRPSPLSDALESDARFYYVHSYHMVVDAPEQAILAARHGYEFTAGVMKGSVLGVQFHPEKSHAFGLALLRAFAAWQPATHAEQAKPAA
jgi:glutamine amidotransferase